ncbi:MAG TPA: hypothetical protein DCS30_14345 [Rhizobiales bacterium]|nr:hypothetical protein [Hyphomicrobiales bacterium]
MADRLLAISAYTELKETTMRRTKLSIFAATMVMAMASLSSTAQAEFCKKYKQTSSNAGQCNNCFVTIKSLRQIQAYGVKASNGWFAELQWVDGDSSVATGWGRWAGSKTTEGFELDLEQQGSTLRMTMQLVENRKRGQVVRAKFKCVQ